MAGAQAQHSLGNRETPRIAAGIFPIGVASGQRMRRYFFGASPPGEGGGAGTTRKSREQQEEAGTAGRSREQCGCRNARNARQRRPPREPAVGGNLPGRQRAAHGRKRAAGGQQSVGQAVASRIEKISCTYKQPATAARCTHRHGGSPGHRESEIASEPCRLGSGKNHAGKQVLSTEIPEILRIREIQRMFTNYHKKELKKSCILKIYV